MNSHHSQIPIRPKGYYVSTVGADAEAPMDNTACLKELTTYKAFTLRKATTDSFREKPAWKRIDVTEEALAQEDIIKAIDKLKKSTHFKPVTDKKRDLAPNQSLQVTKIVDELNQHEHDTNYEWTLTQMESKISKKKGVKLTEAMTIYLKRAPVRGKNPVKLYHDEADRQAQQELREKQRVRDQQMREQQEIRAHQMREQQVRELRDQQFHHQQQQQQAQRAQPQPEIIRLDEERRGRNHPDRRRRDKSRSASRRRDRKPKNRRHSRGRTDSESDPYDSDGSASSISSVSSYTQATSISSRTHSDRDRRREKHSKHGKRPLREKKYLEDQLPRYSRTVMRRNRGMRSMTPPPIGPRSDHLQAAYQVGIQIGETRAENSARIRAENLLNAAERERLDMLDSGPQFIPSVRANAVPHRIVPGRITEGRYVPSHLDDRLPRDYPSYGAERDYRRPTFDSRMHPAERSRFDDIQPSSRTRLEPEPLLRRERIYQDDQYRRPARRQTSFYDERRREDPVRHHDSFDRRDRDTRFPR